MTLKTSSLIIASFAATLIVLLFVTFLSLNNNKRYLAISIELQHTNLMMMDLDEINRQSSAIVAAYRGYAITGNNNFSNEFDTAAQATPGTDPSLAIKYPAFAAEFDTLVHLLNALKQFGTEVIDLRAREREESASERIATLQGARLKKRLDELIVRLEKLGREKLRFLENEQQQLASSATQVNYLLAFLCFTVLSGIFILLYREFIKRTNAEAQLTRINESLESEVIRKSNEFREIVERISDAFVALDKNWRYTYMNEKAGKIFNRDPQQMIGKHIWTEFPEGAGQPFHNPYHQAMALQQHIYVEEYYEPSSLWLESHIYPSSEGLSIFFRDITEKKKTELALKTAFEKLSHHINHSPMAVIEWDSEFRIIRWSGTATTMFQWRESEVLGLRFDEFDFVPEEDKSTITAVTGELMKEKVNSSKSRNRNKTKSGQVLHCEWYNSVVRDEQGKTLSILSLVNNISDRVKAEADLLREKNLSESVVNSLPGIFYLHDWEGKFLRWNKNFETVSGYTREEIATMHPLDFFSEDERYLLWEKIKNVFATGQDQVEAHILTRSGKKIPYYINGRSVTLEDEHYLIGVGLDSSERIAAQTALLQSEKKYRHLFENNPMPMWIIDRETLRFIDVNRAALNHYGYTRVEFLKMSSVDIRPEEEKERYLAILRSPDRGLLYAGIWKHLKKDGSVIQVEIISHGIYLGEREARLVLIKDLTEKLKAEEQLNTSYRQLKELNAYIQKVREDERTRIAREIHDELGQQLTGLKMDAAWVNKRLADEKLVRKMSGMMQLIDATIATVRRISTELRPGILDDFGLVAALEWQCKEFEKRTGIRCHFTATANGAEPGKELSTHIFRVHQEALTNVARHAHATQTDTLLNLTNHQILLIIKDNGRGFDMEEAVKRKSFGLLGIKERAAMLNAEIKIESSRGKGTNITVTIPVISKINEIP